MLLNLTASYNCRWRVLSGEPMNAKKIVAKAGSELTVTERKPRKFIEIVALPQSCINYNMLETRNYVRHFYIHRNATLKLNVFSSNASGEIEVFLDGDGASTENIFVFLGRKNAKNEINLNVFHNMPRTKSNTTAKGIADGKASIIFNGSIKIKKNAQKSDAYLSCDALKLSKESKTKMIPGLFIDANDVKACHAASVREIDEDELFYMKSRGIDADAAQMLSITGFFEPVVTKIISEEMREDVKKKLGMIS